MENYRPNLTRALSVLTVVAWGLFLGLLAGLILSVAYLVILPILWTAISSNSPSDSVNSGYGFYLTYGLLFGVIPATILGAFSGLTISILVVFFASKTKQDASIIGALVPIAVLTSLGAVILISNDFNYLLFFIFLWGLPGLIYIVTGILLTRMHLKRLVNFPQYENASRIAMPLFRILLAAVILFDISFGIYSFLPRTTVKSYLMHWRTPEYVTCNGEVWLEFDQCPGYIISTCSTDLFTHLEESSVDTVEIDLRGKYRNFQWEYEFDRIGTWTGEATIDELLMVRYGDAKIDDSCQPIEDVTKFIGVQHINRQK